MSNSKLLKEAIADAKAVRETALQNAKMALEEAFTPHLKSMLAAKLDEMDKKDDEVKEEEEKVEMGSPQVLNPTKSKGDTPQMLPPKPKRHNPLLSIGANIITTNTA